MGVPMPREMTDSHRHSVVSERDAAQLLSLSLPQLRRMRWDGLAPTHIRLSERRIGYRLSDIDTWLDARQVTHEELGNAQPPKPSAGQR